MKKNTALSLFLALLLTVPVFAGTGLKLVGISNAFYATDIRAMNDTGHVQNVQLDAIESIDDSVDCIGYNLPIGVNGTVRYDIKVNACGQEIRLFENLPIRAFSVVSFNDGTHKNTFVIPPIGYVSQDHSVYIGPLASSFGSKVYITMFGQGRIRVSQYDAKGVPVKVSVHEITPPVTQIPLEFIVGDGSIEIDSLWPFPVYGFVSNASATNSSSVVFPFDGGIDK